MITTYVGTPGIAIQIEEPEEILEAVDALHSQAIDAGVPLLFLRALETCMEQLRQLNGIIAISPEQEARTREFEEKRKQIRGAR